MRDGSPSITAQLVAAARGLSTRVGAAAVDPHDELALRLLPTAAKGALELLIGADRFAPLLTRAVYGLSLGLIDHVALRTAAIDATLRRHVAQGPTQLVLLGAGLDLRAYRLGCLLDSRVFEIDHPASQRYKRARIAGMAAKAQELVHVSVDFAKDDLDAALQAAGHDPARRSLWIWEGVVPYLDEAAFQGTLRTLVARSASGSQVALSYVTRDAGWRRLGRPATAPFLRAVGEPLGIEPTVQEMAAHLRAAGLSPLSDTDTADWYRAHATARGARVIVPYERLVVAERPPQ